VRLSDGRRISFWPDLLVEVLSLLFTAELRLYSIVLLFVAGVEECPPEEVDFLTSEDF
jgi:hypothetical protein